MNIYKFSNEFFNYFQTTNNWIKNGGGGCGCGYDL